MRFFAIFVFSLATFFVTFSEDLQNHFESNIDDENIDLQNKIPENLKASYLKALTYYPELKDQKIRFKAANIKTTLNVRPTLGSVLFNKKENRVYVVRINNSLEKQEILIDSIPFTARVGLFGHELAHILDYKSLNAFQVLGRGIGYNFSGYRESYEKHIDKITVENGLGWQLYDWATYIQDHPHVPLSYKTFKKQFYMEDKDILEAIYDLQLDQSQPEF